MFYRLPKYRTLSSAQHLFNYQAQLRRFIGTSSAKLKRSVNPKESPNIISSKNNSEASYHLYDLHPLLLPPVLYLTVLFFQAVTTVVGSMQWDDFYRLLAKPLHEQIGKLQKTTQTLNDRVIKMEAAMKMHGVSCSFLLRSLLILILQYILN